jgi:hypothetical protein
VFSSTRLYARVGQSSNLPSAGTLIRYSLFFLCTLSQSITMLSLSIERSRTAGFAITLAGFAL